MMVAGKYVPPHLRNGAKKTEVTPFRDAQKPKVKSGKPTNPNMKSKKAIQRDLKKEARKAEKAEKVKEEGPMVKPHCELFLADLPPALRSLQTLAGFFHPYGEISNIVYVPAGKCFPADIIRRNLFDQDDFSMSNCAIIEFLTARVAKFVVGVLRKRIEGLNFRIGLLKPGLSDEMKNQTRRLEESIHVPTYLAKPQDQFLKERESSQYSSEELSESEVLIKPGMVFNAFPCDQAYFTGSSEVTSDSDFGRYSSDDDSTDLLTLALKNGIKVIRD
jgi:hypothetical protein